MKNSAKPSKTCARCGRVVTWRRKWAKDWDNVRYCSQRCRKLGLRSSDDQLEQAIVSLLATRGGTICPSEAARLVNPDHWHDLMEPARCAGRRMAARGEVVFSQSGKPVDPSEFRGPVRLARGPGFGQVQSGER